MLHIVQSPVHAGLFAFYVSVRVALAEPLDGFIPEFSLLVLVYRLVLWDWEPGFATTRECLTLETYPIKRSNDAA